MTMTYEWQLRRNCSFSPTQLAGVFGSLCVLSLLIAAFFWLVGAPFVLLFAGLEIAALGTAFVVYARHASDGERVVLAGDALWVERWQGSMRYVERFNPRWVRVEVEQTPKHTVRLGESGRAIAIGRHVTEKRRLAFAHELQRALRNI
jgi:uncharacterized membrane protein